jgi:molybdopterin-guanine dinucleotide biosynthesis protein A
MSPLPPEAQAGFSAVLLAGGRSIRMGRDKALLPHPESGLALVLHQLATLCAAGATELFLSVRSGVDYPQVPAHIPRLTDDGGRGPMAGIASALATTRQSRLLVLAVDLPGVTPALIRDWVSRTPSDRGFVPIGPRGTEPLCALYPRACLPFFNSALTANRLALRNVAGELTTAGLLNPFTVNRDEHQALGNWNTPADLAGGLGH